MNIISLIFKSLFVTVLGLYLVYGATKEPDQVFVFDFIWVFLAIIISIFVYIRTLKNNLEEYADTNSYISFLPIISGVVFPFILFMVQTRENPTLILAADDGDTTKVFLDLRTDGTYQFSNGSALGIDYFYGTYQIQDSIITLDKTNIDQVIKSNKLVIRPILEATSPEYDTMVYQLDKMGKILKNATGFRLREDNRTSPKR